MEEDIKILECMLKTAEKNRRGNDEIRFEVNSNCYKALQNLIARNKELEEKCKKKNKTIETMQFIKSIQRGQENTILMTEEQCAVKNKYMIEVSNGEFVDVNELYSIWKNSIPKSKVKKEYVSKKELKRIINENMYLEMMRELRKLIED